MVDVTYHRDVQKIGENNKNFKGEIMGLYINPENMSKEAFLNANGTEIARGEDEPSITFDQAGNDEIIACFVDNGPFSALAVAYSEKEFDYFKKPDGRYKVWYTIPKYIAEPSSAGWESYIKD